MTLEEIRAKYPMYANKSDLELLMGLHQKFYPTKPMHDFIASIPGADLAYAKSPKGQAADYYVAQISKPMAGEDEAATFKRLYGSADGPVGTPVGPLGAAGRGALQGLTFGAGDEIVAAGQAAATPVINAVRGMFGAQPLPQNSYDQNLQAERDRIALGREQNPVTAYGSEIAGAIASPANKLFAPFKGASLFGNIAAGAANGVLSGAAYGFGAGEGGAGSRATSAAEMGGIGGGMGAAAAPIISGGSALLRGANNVRASIMGAENETQASRFIKKLMERSGKSEAQIAAEIQAAAAEGQPQFTTADAMGTTGQNGLSTMTRQPGDAKQVVTDFLNTRQEGAGYPVTGGQGNRIKGFIQTAMGATDTADQRAAAIAAERKATSNAAYGAARANAAPVDVSGALGVIDQRVSGMNGMGVTGDGIDAQLRGFRDRLAAPASKLPNGATAVELSDFNRVLGVKQDVQDAIDVALRAGKNNLARELGALKSELDAALEASSPDYRFANDQHSKASRALDAVDMGKAAFSNTVRTADVADQFAKTSPERPKPFGGTNIAQPGAQPYGTGLDGQSAYRSGYADRALAAVESQAPGVNKARGLLDSKNMGDFGLMASDPALLNRQLGREDTMFQTRARALGGSQTADNLANEKDAVALMKGAATTAGHVVTGNLMGLARQAGDLFANLATGKNEKTREMIARMLLSQNPQAATVPAIVNAAKINGREAAVNMAMRALMRPAQMSVVNGSNAQ